MRGSCQAPHSTERMQRYAFSLNYASISAKTCIPYSFFLPILRRKDSFSILRPARIGTETTQKGKENSYHFDYLFFKTTQE